MTRHLVGLLLLAAALGPVTLGARSARARLLPGWTGAPAATATIVVATALITLTAEALGLFGWFSLVPLLVTLIVVGLATREWGRRHRSSGAPPRPEVEPVLPTLGRYLALVTGSVVLSEWGWRTYEQLRTGMDSVDTIWYHLPLAARFSQTGEITPLHNFEDQALTTYYPATSSLWHGMGMEFLGSDLASVFMNLGWLAATLLAAWAIGRPFGVAPFTASAAATALALPAFTATQPGGAYNDVVGVFLLLAAIAVLVTATFEGGEVGGGALVVVGLGIGLAVSTKFQFIVPGGLLTLGALVAGPRRDVIRRGAHLAPAIAATGAFWYVRNLVLAGSPLPALRLAIGPLELRQIEPELPISRVTDYVGVGRYWSDYFFPGFDAAYGGLWWLVLIVAVVPVGLLFVRDKPLAVLGAVSLLALCSFAVSPVAISLGPNPVFFGIALRYTILAVTLGAILAMVLAAATRSPRALLVLAVAMVAILVSNMVDRSDWQEAREQALDLPIWEPESVVALVASFAVVAGAAWAWRWAAQASDRRPVVLGLVAAVIAVSSIPALVVYRNDRYESTSLMPETFAAVNVLSDQRIGLTGTTVQYPLYGEDLSNHVQVISERGDHGTADGYDSCGRFMELINEGAYDLVVVTPRGFPITDREAAAARWLEDDPAAAVMLTEGPISTFRISATLDPARCPTS